MKVSVIIPLYNKVEYFADTLKSVLSQTFADFELIVVDDGSTDGSAEIASGCPDPRLHLITQPNAGVSAARNRGIEAASAPLLAFLDADDEWQPLFLERTLAALETYPDALAVFTNFQNTITGQPCLQHTPKKSGVISDFFALCLANNGYGIHTSALLVRRASLQAIGGFPVGVRLGEDTDTWCRLAWSGKIVYLTEMLSLYHMEVPNSASKMNMRDRSIYPEFARTFRRYQYTGRIPKQLLQSSAHYANWLLLAYVCELHLRNDRAEAWRVLREDCRLGLSSSLHYLSAMGRLLLPFWIFTLVSQGKKTFSQKWRIRQQPKTRHLDHHVEKTKYEVLPD